MDEVNDLVHASIYLNWLPKPYCKGKLNKLFPLLY